MYLNVVYDTYCQLLYANVGSGCGVVAFKRVFAGVCSGTDCGLVVARVKIILWPFCIYQQDDCDRKKRIIGNKPWEKFTIVKILLDF